MSVKGGPNIVTSGLVLELDAGNIKSYQSGSTTWFDKSGNVNNGTLTNGPTFNTGSLGSIVFDRVDDYVDLGGSLPLIENTFTVNSWINTNVLPTASSAGDIQNIIGGPSIVNNSDYLCIRTKRIAIWNRESSGDGAPIGWYSSQTDLVVDTWYNVVLTCDSGYYKMYINGSLDSDIPYLGNTWNNLQSRYIGKLSNERFFSGKISIVQYYNKKFSADEVLQNYNATKGRFGL